MKFELSDLRKQITDIEIINDLRAVANSLNKHSLKLREYCKENGAKYSYQTAKKRFGNWETALKKSGLETEKSVHGIEYGGVSLKSELLIEDLKRVSNKIQNPAFTINEYDKYGKFGSATIQKRFGGWNKAKKIAGLEIGRKYNTGIDEYMQNILDLWVHYGRQPKYAEVLKPLSKFSISSYENKFGTWRMALEKFIEYINSGNNKEMIEVKNEEIGLTTPSHHKNELKDKEFKIKRTSRSINLRLRFTVFKRDNFSCKKCGQAPAKNPAVILHVDHIIPWSKGGETVVENLETLCDRCNLGKSNIV